MFQGPLTPDAMESRWKYPNPFDRDESAVNAWIHLNGGGPLDAIRLRQWAVRQRRIVNGKVTDFRFLESIPVWAKQVGLHIVSLVAPPAEPSIVRLDRFCKAHPGGRYFIRVAGFKRRYAVALIDGLLYCRWWPSDNVVYYAKVDLLFSRRA